MFNTKYKYRPSDLQIERGDTCFEKRNISSMRDVAIFTIGRNTVSGCKIASVGCIYGSNSLHDCIIGRGLYTLTNIRPDVFLSVVKMPCTHL